MLRTNRHVVARAAKNTLSRLKINLNRWAGRELVPVETRILNIETSSLCNLKCRFCGYVKKSSPKVSMSDAFFRDCVTQATAMGFTGFELTPCTGDVFMDRRAFNKFEVLDNNPAVEGYRFFTNLTIPKPSDIERLTRLSKLRNLTVSIYGHDLESFRAITLSTEKLYRRLIANLTALLERLDACAFNLDIGIRTTNDAPRRPAGELMALVERFRARGVNVRRAHVYNNFGGTVTAEDVRGLAIDIDDASWTYKNGACSRLFTTYQIMATGIVNGCACRDVDATLAIGDLNEMPLHEILSPGNPAYMRLIEEQQRGEFRPVCQSCDYYKSIYHSRMTHRKSGMQSQSIEAFKERLRAAGECARRRPGAGRRRRVNSPHATVILGRHDPFFHPRARASRSTYPRHIARRHTHRAGGARPRRHQGQQGRGRRRHPARHLPLGATMVARRPPSAPRHGAAGAPHPARRRLVRGPRRPPL
jgi:MoaA/NifB/PqqE/SkfB family radical SAM enzyme